MKKKELRERGVYGWLVKKGLSAKQVSGLVKIIEEENNPGGDIPYYKLIGYLQNEGAIMRKKGGKNG